MAKFFVIILLFSAPVFAATVNINQADAQTISSSLIGISLTKAQAIVKNREQYGNFKTVDDLKRVIGIGDKTIAINKEKILLTDYLETSVRSVVPAVNQNISLSSASEQSSPFFSSTLIAVIILLTVLSAFLVIQYHLYKKRVKK